MSKLVVLWTLVAFAGLMMADLALAQDEGGATDNEAATANDTPEIDTSVDASDDTADDETTPGVVACATTNHPPCPAKAPPAATSVPSFATLGPLGGKATNWIVADHSAR
jgi:hypothetical protein